MEVILSSKTKKYLKSLNKPIKGRIDKALIKLCYEPPEGDIKKLTGRDEYRLRVGDYRLLFKARKDAIIVYKIAPRGEAYKD
jgi:mRNA interferase RelE/StbE